jgi:hypothetical protein
MNVTVNTAKGGGGSARRFVGFLGVQWDEGYGFPRRMASINKKLRTKAKG